MSEVKKAWARRLIRRMRTEKLYSRLLVGVWLCAFARRARHSANAPDGPVAKKARLEFSELAAAAHHHHHTSA